MQYFDLHQIVGPGHDHTRTTILYGALSGHAETWYEHSVRTGTRSVHVFPPDFITILLRLADRFITPAAVTKAQSGFDKVVYTTTVGIQAYVRKLERISKHILLPIDKYTLHRRIVEAIPSSMRNHLIDLRGLSTSTSSVIEWVEAISKRERELLEKAAFYDHPPTAKRFVASTSRTTAPKKAVPTGRSTSDRQNTNATLPTRSNDRARQSGPKIPSKQKVPLAEITCHACGKKGHYRGSKECPKTLTSACIHALGIEEDQAEPETPQEPEEEVENPFKGEEFDGEADAEIAILRTMVLEPS